MREFGLMRPLGAFVPSAAALLAACAQDAPVDCPEYFTNVDECVDQATKDDDGFTWDECLPYSEPTVIVGLFAQDFEHNVFWEGPNADLEEVWSHPYPATRLQLDRPLKADAEGMQLATITRLRFVGRRPLCIVTTGESWLMVDEILSEEVIETTPSQFQSASK